MSVGARRKCRRVLKRERTTSEEELFFFPFSLVKNKKKKKKKKKRIIGRIKKYIHSVNWKVSIVPRESRNIIETDEDIARIQGSPRRDRFSIEFELVGRAS